MAVKAKESSQIRKARERIRRNIAKAEQQMNPAALLSMRKLIEEQIGRHQAERINLKERQITLFDENRHSARTQSKYVKQLFRHIQEL